MVLRLIIGQSKRTGPKRSGTLVTNGCAQNYSVAVFIQPNMKQSRSDSTGKVLYWKLQRTARLQRPQIRI